MSTRGPCVLVVEDESTARELLCDSLVDAGCAAIGVADGREAVAYLEQHSEPPCVILLDLMMPGMNGWKFREWQRANADHAAVPVVLLSAVRNLADEARKLGVAGYLEKPLKFSSLLASVARHCGPCQQPPKPPPP
jgi:two-component system chemotaxis response regulator CheY